MFVYYGLIMNNVCVRSNFSIQITEIIENYPAHGLATRLQTPGAATGPQHQQRHHGYTE